MFDLVIKNGLVIDGSGAAGKEADVAVENGKIVAVEKLKDNIQSKEVINAAGKIVCPGFVDIQDHSDGYWTLFTSPRLESKAMQGVTTIIGGNCGSSLAPVLGQDSVCSIRKWTNLDNISINWVRTSDFLDEVRRRKIGLNFGTLVGHETLRRGLTGDDVRRVGDEEVKKMGRMLSDSLEEGVFGMSTGLAFSHAKAASNDEIRYLAEIIKSAGGYYASHIRGEAEALLPSVNETIQIGRDTEVSIQISHFKAIGKRYWPDMEQAIRMIDLANDEGVHIDFDIYPYNTTGSVLYIILPDWVSEGGRSKMIARLKDVDLRQKIVEEMRSIGYDYGNIVVSICPKIREVVGRRIVDIAQGQEISPEEAIIELLISANGHVIVFDRGALDENNIRMELMNKHCMIASADAAYNVEYARTGELVHPRCFGTFARTIGKYVREERVLSLEEAICKMTNKPAQKVGLKKRGLLQEGYFADIAVFDGAAITERSSYENPYQYAAGVEHVIVNGKVAVRNGQHTGELAGEVLTKR